MQALAVHIFAKEDQKSAYAKTKPQISRADLVGNPNCWFSHAHAQNAMFQYVFQPGQMQPNSLYEGRTEEGVAILSKFPIVSHSHKFLFRLTKQLM